MEQEGLYGEQFTVDTLAKANWAMGKIAENKRQIGEIEKAAEEQIDAVAKWRDKECNRLQKGVDYLTSILQDWTFAEAEKRGKKSINLVGGKVKVSKSPDAWSMGNEKVDKYNDALIDWAKDNAKEYILKEYFVKWAELKKTLEPQKDGRVVSKETGEVIPGLTFVAGMPVVKVEVDDE